jgi:hypothetical protein
MQLMDLPQPILNGPVASFFSASDAQSFARTCKRALDDLKKTLKVLRCKRKNSEVYAAWPERWRQQAEAYETEEDEKDEEDEEETWSQPEKKGKQIEVFNIFSRCVKMCFHHRKHILWLHENKEILWSHENWFPPPKTNYVVIRKKAKVFFL